MGPSNTSYGHALPPDVRSRLARIEREYGAGELTQRGYELRRSRILSPIDMERLSLSLNIDGTGRLNTSAVSHYRCHADSLEWKRR